jgi:hypothetical protein
MGDPLISTGLNMLFKKVEPFSQYSSSGDGPLNPPQPKEPKQSFIIQTD